MKKRVLFLTLVALIVLPLTAVYAVNYEGASRNLRSNANTATSCADLGYSNEVTFGGIFEGDSIPESGNATHSPVTLFSFGYPEGEGSTEDESQENKTVVTSFSWKATEGIEAMIIFTAEKNKVSEFEPSYSGSASAGGNAGINQVKFCWGDPKSDPTQAPEPVQKPDREPIHGSNPIQEIKPEPIQELKPQPIPEAHFAIGLALSATPATYRAAGDTIHYTYLLTNNGSEPLYPPYEIEDAGLDVACPQALALLEAGASVTCSASYTISESDITAESVSTTALAKAKDDSGNGVSSNQASVSVTLAPDQSLTLDVKASADHFSAVGESIDLEYLLTNSGLMILSGPFSIQDDKATVICPEDVESLAPTESLKCSATYEITKGDLMAGGIKSLAVAYAEDGAIVSNTDSIILEGPKQEPAIQLMINITGVNEDSSASIFNQVGDIITYQFTITNTGNVPLTDVIVTNPAITVSGSPIEKLSPGVSESAAFTASYSVKKADLEKGKFTNTATVTGVDPDGNSVSHQYSAAIKARKQVPSIQLIQKVAAVNGDSSLKEIAAPGDKVTFSYTIINTGTIELTNIVISDSAATVEGEMILTLAPGASDNTTFTATYVVTAADLDAGEFTNLATVTALAPDNDEVVYEASATVKRIQLY